MKITTAEIIKQGNILRTIIIAAHPKFEGELKKCPATLSKYGTVVIDLTDCSLELREAVGLSHSSIVVDHSRP